MKNIIVKFVAQCDVRQRYKVEIVASPRKLQPLPTPDSIWTNISMDFIEGLPSSQEKCIIFVVVEHLIKYAHFCDVCNPYIASSIARIFIENIVKLHGMPRYIITDHDRVFTSRFYIKLF